MALCIRYRVFQIEEDGRLVPVRLRFPQPREVLTGLYESPDAVLAEAETLGIPSTLAVEFLVIPVIVPSQPPQ